jgi:hypothetical protein
MSNCLFPRRCCNVELLKVIRRVWNVLRVSQLYKRIKTEAITMKMTKQNWVEWLWLRRKVDMRGMHRAMTKDSFLTHGLTAEYTVPKMKNEAKV